MFEKALIEIEGDLEKYAGGLPKRGTPLTPKFVAEKMMVLADEKLAPESGSDLILKANS